MLVDGTFGALPERMNEPLRLIIEKLATTERLVSDLLVAARIEAGGVKVAADQIDFVQVATSAAEKARGRAELAGGSLYVEAQDPVVNWRVTVS